MSRRPRVVVAAQDPGAANVLAPVAARLRAERRVDPVIWGLLQARAVFRRARVPLSPGLSRDSLVRRFREDPPELLLTGTNEDRDGLDRVLTLEARRLGIPVLGVLDYWSNYVARYSGPGRSERFRFLPDLVFVMDPRARRDMIRLGFPPSRLRVVGHAHLERFAGRPRQTGARGRHQMRMALGVRPGEKLLCFASETYGMTWDRAYRFPPLTESRERTEIILEHLLAALDGLRRTHGLKPFV
ncbi:MAG TPA: hypothetical protein VG457_11085, partial [Planctomycetota bacterium]|nr:hypothetical protein [Planctomycetota bacterium]